MEFDECVDSDYATVKYDPDGNELWVARYNGPGNRDDAARAIALDALGNVYVTGGSWGVGTGSDYATIKYDTDGNELWVARYNGPGNGADAAYAIALDAVGNVHVTGGSWGVGTGSDYATTKYAQTEAADVTSPRLRSPLDRLEVPLSKVEGSGQGWQGRLDDSKP